MRIGILHPFYKDGTIGGSERVVETLAIELRKNGVEAEILSLNIDASNAFNRNAFSPVLHVKLWAQFLSLKYSGKLSKFDLIHCHVPHTAIPISLFKRTVITFHSYVKDIPTSSYKPSFMGMISPLYYTLKKHCEHLNALTATKIIAVSDHLKNRLVQDMHLDQRKISVVHNCIDLKNAEGKIGPSPYGKGFNLFCIGRVSYEKGFDIALRAMSIIDSKNLTLYIAGPFPDPKYKKYLDSICIAYQINVKFLGPIADEKFSYYAHADAVLIPSRTEGMPLAAIEALACDAVIIASDIPQMKETLGDAAIYFKSEDNIDLKESIAKLIKKPELGRKLRENAKARKSIFDIAHLAEDHIRIYKQAIGG